MGSFRKKNKNAKGKVAHSEKGADAQTEVKGETPTLHGYSKCIDMTNAAFEEYYRQQCICGDDGEWEDFLKFCRIGLPCGLRVNGTLGEHSKDIWRGLLALRELPEEKKNEENSEESTATPAHVFRPKVLDWYPNELAFQFDHLDSRKIKKDAKLKKLKEILMAREVYGAIQRQETVSMIPPHLLDVQPDDLVLDLCAAPGSKTCQMLEKLHWSKAGKGEQGGGKFV